MNSYAINENLFLVQHKINENIPTLIEVPTNHIIVLDCSGSMYNDLPKIREQLKKKLPKLLAEKDTISIIWFSGKNEFGTLIEAEKVENLLDLQTFNKTIDRWLKPLGLTGFKQPLEEVGTLISKIGEGVFSLFFMSDGCDNQWQHSQIIQAIENIADKISAATIVEYGYYADRNLLMNMAEKFCGNLIFSENFDKYEPVFENTITKKLSGCSRVKIEVGNVVNDFAFAINDNDLLTFKVENGFVNVPEDLQSIFFFSKEMHGDVCTDLSTLSHLAATETFTASAEL